MSPGRLLTLFALALIITVAIAAAAHRPPATTSDSAIDPKVFTNSIIEMIKMAKLF